MPTIENASLPVGPTLRALNVIADILENRSQDGFVDEDDIPAEEIEVACEAMIRWIRDLTC